MVGDDLVGSFFKSFSNQMDLLLEFLFRKVEERKIIKQVKHHLILQILVILCRRLCRNLLEGFECLVEFLLDALKNQMKDFPALLTVFFDVREVFIQSFQVPVFCFL